MRRCNCKGKTAERSFSEMDEQSQGKTAKVLKIKHYDQQSFKTNIAQQSFKRKLQSLNGAPQQSSALSTVSLNRAFQENNAIAQQSFSTEFLRYSTVSLDRAFQFTVCSTEPAQQSHHLLSEHYSTVCGHRSTEPSSATTCIHIHVAWVIGSYNRETTIDENVGTFEI